MTRSVSALYSDRARSGIARSRFTPSCTARLEASRIRAVSRPNSSAMHSSVAMMRAAFRRLSARRSSLATGSSSAANTSASAKGQK